MSNKDFIETEGKVVEVLSNSMFRVSLDQGNLKPVIAYLSGKIRKHRIRILLGDQVLLQISPHDTTRGRIIYRK